MAGECGTCRAPIHWALTPKGERTPVDYAPTREGNIVLLRPTVMGGKLLAVVLSGEILEATRAETSHLFVNHWATCRDRGEWRERTDATKDRHGFQNSANPRSPDCVRCGRPKDDPRHQTKEKS